MKIQLEQLDLLEPWPRIAMRDGYRAVRVLVRLGKIPIGEVLAKPTRKRVVSHRLLRKRIAAKYTTALLKNLAREALATGEDALKSIPPGAMPSIAMTHSKWNKTTKYVEEYYLLPEGLPSPMRDWVIAAQARQNWPMPLVTIAVPTRDRESVLEECIRHLQKQDYPNFEILIVDNSSDPVPAREIAERTGARYVRSSVPGVSRARNMALAHAKHEWVAFTDDDCRPEPNWLKELVRPIQDENCRCVCGLILPAQLENPSEITFEIYGGLGRGYAAKVYDRAFLTASRTKPAPTWNIGASSNQLLHRKFVLQFGGHDIDMGPGPYSVGGCGEDTDIYYQVLRRGYNVHYTPRAVVHHLHRSSPKALRKQILGYATGHAAYHARCFFRYGDHRSLIHLAWHLPRWFARSLKHAIRGKSKYPFSLTLLEIRGTAIGPARYAMKKIARVWRDCFAKPQGVFIPPPNPIEMAPPTPPAPAPHKLIYDALVDNKSHRAA